MQAEEWMKAEGVSCHGCGVETLRFYRVCPHCLAALRGLQGKPATPFSEDEWELVKVYEFNRRTTYIYRNLESGHEEAYDVLKEAFNGDRSLH